MRIYTSKDPVSRFSTKIAKTDACWLWTGAKDGKGYGRFYNAKRYVQAHRFAWELASGKPLLDREWVLHTCDIRACVRNDDAGEYKIGGINFQRIGHLFIGTAADNTHDMISKERGGFTVGHNIHPNGEQHGRSKLTEVDVINIRLLMSNGWLGKDLSKRFNVSTATISRIIHGNGWKCVPLSRIV